MSYTAFVDLLQQVPDLAKSLTPRTRKALLSTTRALQRHIQQATTSIKFRPDCDAQTHLQLLVGNQYPQLRHLDLSNAVEYIDLFDSQNQQTLSLAQWPLLTHLTFYDPLYSAGAYIDSSSSLDMVNAAWPLLEQLDLGSTPMHSGQWAQLAQGAWPNLKVLGLSGCKADAAAVTELVRADWPSLAKLDLSCNSLDAHCIAMLTTADWVHLKELDIAVCELDDLAVLELVRGQWLCLEVLNLSGNKALTTDALGHLIKADWPLLRDLQLWSSVSAPANCTGMLQVVESFPCLENLGSFSAISPFALSRLTLLNWSQLKRVVLPLCQLEPNAAQLLAQASWPLLEELVLRYNPDMASGLHWLATAHWPGLQLLSLAGIPVDDAAALSLKESNWPVLHTLDLNGTYMSDVGLSLIAKARWPQLERLDLSRNYFGWCDASISPWHNILEWVSAFASLFQLDTAVIRGKGSFVLQDGVNRLGPSDQLADGVWPQLKLVHFGWG